jgi:hypothetical protein
VAEFRKRGRKGEREIGENKRNDKQETINEKCFNE